MIHRDQFLRLHGRAAQGAVGLLAAPLGAARPAEHVAAGGAGGVGAGRQAQGTAPGLGQCLTLGGGGAVLQLLVGCPCLLLGLAIDL